MNAKSVTLTFVRNPIVVGISEFRGEQRLDIRHFYETDTGDLAPTKKGVNIPLRDASVLVAAVKRTVESGQEVNPNVSGRNPITVKVSKFRGKDRLDIRHYWDNNGSLTPTQKGVNLPAEFGSNLLVALDDVLSSVKVAA